MEVSDDIRVVQQ